MLLGSIKSDTVAKLFKALTRASADGILLLESGGQRAQIVFKEGKFSKASAAGLSGEDALIAVKRWSDGHYALKKRTEDQPLISKGHAFIAVEDKATQQQLAGWLHEESFESSVIPYIGELEELVNFLRPEVVIMDCPDQSVGMPCQDLLRRLEHDDDAPVLVVIPSESGECGCEVDKDLELKPFSKDRLTEILAAHLEPTATGVAFQQLVAEGFLKATKTRERKQEQEQDAVQHAPTLEMSAVPDEVQGDDEEPERATSAPASPPSSAPREELHHANGAPAATQGSNSAPMAAMAVLAIGSIALWVLFLLLRG